MPEVAGLHTPDEVATGPAGLERAWDERLKLVYAVFRRRDGRFVGDVGLYALDLGRGAIDIVFRTAAELRRLYPRLLQHAMTTFGSTDVPRFLGRRISLRGDIPKRFAGEVVSDLHQRQEGVRLKHRLNTNSVKLDDQAFTVLGRLLRAEGTINDVHDFRVYRPREGDAEGELAWRPLRPGHR